MTINIYDSGSGQLPGGSPPAFITVSGLNISNAESIILLSLSITGADQYYTSTSVVGGGLIWSQRGTRQQSIDSVTGQFITREYWWAPSSSAIGAFNITINLSGIPPPISGLSPVVADAFAINGLFNYASPFDTHSSLPVIENYASTIDILVNCGPIETIVGTYAETTKTAFTSRNWVTYGDALVGNDFEEILFVVVSGMGTGFAGAEFKPSETSFAFGVVGLNSYWLNGFFGRAGIAFGRPHVQLPYSFTRICCCPVVNMGPIISEWKFKFQNLATTPETISVTLTHSTGEPAELFVWLGSLLSGPTASEVTACTANGLPLTQRWERSYTDFFGSPPNQSTFHLELWTIPITDGTYVISADLSQNSENDILAIPIVGFGSFDSNAGLPFVGTSNGQVSDSINYATSGGDNLILFSMMHTSSMLGNLYQSLPNFEPVITFNVNRLNIPFGGGSRCFTLCKRLSNNPVVDTAMLTGILPTAPDYVAELIVIDAIKIL